ncbi:hypothetical protein RRG08_025841 [Elysia crispata]|uniref:Uncharacterized protein n=1 Tax=Elysia crispata TaxID=231223 RepID=A0AAE0Y426_9GAST|nr:hypothetical protein RRG08_025841 [Elysia crispata]
MRAQGRPEKLKLDQLAATYRTAAEILDTAHLPDGDISDGPFPGTVMALIFMILNFYSKALKISPIVTTRTLMAPSQELTPSHPEKTAV